MGSCRRSGLCSPVTPDERRRLLGTTLPTTVSVVSTSSGRATPVYPKPSTPDKPSRVPSVSSIPDIGSGMDKILKGIAKFGSSGTKATYLKQIEQRAVGKIKPLAVFVTCVDPRMLTTELTGTKAGEVFFVRNAGNMVPSYKSFLEGSSCGEAGVFELGCLINNIRNIVVCGHSDCKAVEAMFGMRHKCTSLCHEKNSPLTKWLASNGVPTVQKFSEVCPGEEINFNKPLTFSWGSKTATATIDPENKLNMVDKFSQVHVLQQASHVSTYPMLQKMLDSGELRISAMWFDFDSATLYAFSPKEERFLAVTEENVAMLINTLCH